MPGAPHPFRDGLIAVSVGGILALLLVFGVRAQVGERPAEPADPAVPVITPGPGTDACQRFDGGGGGVPQLDPSPGPEFPRQEFLLDTGRPLEVRGTGNAEIAYQRLGEFATVVDFDLSELQRKPHRVQHRGSGTDRFG